MRTVVSAAVDDHPRLDQEREGLHDLRDMLCVDMRTHEDDWAAMSVDLHPPAGIVVVWLIAALGTDVLP